MTWPKGVLPSRHLAKAPMQVPRKAEEAFWNSRDTSFPGSHIPSEQLADLTIVHEAIHGSCEVSPLSPKEMKSPW